MLCFELCTNCCSTQFKAENGEVRTTWHFVDEKMDALATLWKSLIVAPRLELPCSESYLPSGSDMGNSQTGCVLMEYQPDGKRKCRWVLLPNAEHGRTKLKHHASGLPGCNVSHPSLEQEYWRPKTRNLYGIWRHSIVPQPWQLGWTNGQSET